MAGVVGSSVAPAAYGVQHMPQPTGVLQHQIQPMGQGDDPLCLSTLCKEACPWSLSLTLKHGVMLDYAVKGI